MAEPTSSYDLTLNRRSAIHANRALQLTVFAVGIALATSGALFFGLFDRSYHLLAAILWAGAAAALATYAAMTAVNRRIPVRLEITGSGLSFRRPFGIPLEYRWSDSQFDLDLWETYRPPNSRDVNYAERFFVIRGDSPVAVVSAEAFRAILDAAERHGLSVQVVDEGQAGGLDERKVYRVRSAPSGSGIRFASRGMNPG